MVLPPAVDKRRLFKTSSSPNTVLAPLISGPFLAPLQNFVGAKMSLAPFINGPFGALTILGGGRGDLVAQDPLISITDTTASTTVLQYQDNMTRT